MPRPVDVEARAELLAEAYTFRWHIDSLEDEVARHTGGTLPHPLVNWVQVRSMAAVVAFVSGLPEEHCPFDTGDVHPLRRALGRYWWECYEAQLEQYRESKPPSYPAPRLIDEYQADDWDPVRH